MYKIKINKLTLFGNHGVNSFEINMFNQFDITVICLINNKISTINDDIDEVLDYNELIDLIYHVFNKKRYKLVEKLASDIANAIKVEFKVKRYKILIKKINPLINNQIDSFEVIYGNLDD